MKAILNLVLTVLIISSVGFSQSGKKYEQPILVTSAGQSADVVLAGMILKKMNLNYKIKPLAKENELDGIKTLIIVPGFSSKGLGAAGISREQEKTRITNLISAAKRLNIKIVMLHIGGTARRGQQSDDFNELSAEASSDMIVVKQGDEDKFFTNIASTKKIKIQIVEKIAAVTEALKKIF